MTVTAQGSAMRCDYANCDNVATVEVDAWAYCVDHAGTQDSDRVGAPQPRIGRPPVKAVASMPSTTAAVLASPTDPGPFGLVLLQQARGHSNKRIRTLGEKIETQLDDLRTRIADLAEDERRKQAEAAAKEQARQDIVRLEQQLAEARAALRPAAKKTSTAKPIAGDGILTSPQPCTNCGGAVTRPAGTAGRWASRCDTCKASA